MSHPSVERMQRERRERAEAINDVEEAALTAIERLLAATDPFRGFRGTEEELEARAAAVDVLNAAGRTAVPSDDDERDEDRQEGSLIP